MAAISPYKRSPTDEEEQDPYGGSGLSDSNSGDPNQPPPSPKTTGTAEPYTPPTTAATPDAQKPEPSDAGPATKTDLPPVRTFAQMEGEGQARPPVPESQPAVTGLLTGGDVQQPIGDPGIITQPGLQPYVPPGPPQFQPDVPPTPDGGYGGGEVGPIQPPQGGEPVDILPPPPIGGVGDQPIQPYVPPGPPQFAGDQPGDITPQPIGNAVDQPAQPLGGGPQQPIGGGTDNPTTGLPALPGAVDPIVSLLTGGASGSNTSPLQDATTKATLDQLNNPNPYNADEVKREYADLGAGIDADYDTRQRGLSNQFAQRGLYGSVGKDFASGRASDTEIGRRSAKEQLASSLATAQAQSAAQAKRDAISQGQAGTQQGQGNQLAWLQQLMGYGNDAFNHDLQTANFQEGQNNDEQDYLLKLLQAGYGV